jgi:hypothetical protein
VPAHHVQDVLAYLHTQGSGFRVQGSGFRVQGLGFRVQGSGVGVYCAEYPRISACIVKSFRFRRSFISSPLWTP